MKDKKLNDLLYNYIDFSNDNTTRKALRKYIQENYKNIDNDDFKKLSLSLLEINNMFYISSCYHWQDLINNIDDDDFLDDEDNYM